jgi:hypothetical protein
MKAKTIQGKNPEEIRKALNDSLSGDFKASLAIIFMSISHNLDEVCEIFNNKQIKIFGSTSSGEFISEDIIEGGIVAMLLDIDPDHFELFFRETGEHSDFEIAKQLGKEGNATFENAVFIIASGWSNDIDGDQIIKGIEEGFGSETVIFGGMAGDDLELVEPKVFTLGKSSKSGLLGLIIDGDKLNISGTATCGWKPVGITRTITKSSANVIYTIDEKPALDLVLKYLGLSVDEENLNNTVFNLGAYYPLQIQKEDAPPVMRTAMFGNTEDRSLICAGNVPQGSKVRLSLPPDFDAIDTVEEECIEVKQEQIQKADAVIMFSCISRYLSFGMMTSDEINRVQNVWNAPFIGFFSYGEYGKSKLGHHEFHNNTCCVVALKEK